MNSILLHGSIFPIFCSADQSFRQYTTGVNVVAIMSHHFLYEIWKAHIIPPIYDVTANYSLQMAASFHHSHSQFCTVRTNGYTYDKTPCFKFDTSSSSQNSVKLLTSKYFFSKDTRDGILKKRCLWMVKDARDNHLRLKMCTQSKDNQNYGNPEHQAPKIR